MRKLAVACAALLGAALAPLEAAASNGLETPDNGAYQVGRGGAWIARADDPLAVYFNPAGLVRQASGVHVGAHLMFLSRCFTRTGQSADDSSGSTTYGQYGFPVSPGNNYPGPGAGELSNGAVGPPADVCEATTPFPNPQLAANIRVLDQLAIGVGVLGPHGVGSAEWPESIPFKNRFGEDVTQPSPQRYMLVKSSSRILFPTLSVAYAFNDQIAVGAGFTWGVAIAEFENFSEALSPPPAAGDVCGPNMNQPCVPSDDYTRDVRSKLSATDIFIPGFVIGALYSPTRNLDVAAWFRASDAVDTEASVRVESSYWDAAGTKNEDPCAGQAAGCNVTPGEKPGDPGYAAGRIKLPIPMEAKLGVRFHYPLQQPGPRPKWAEGTKKVRDPLSEDRFDVEANFTYANNSAVKAIQVRFKPGIAIAGTPGTLPACDTTALPGCDNTINADIPHNWKDVFGVRLGGEVVVLPGRLAARAGFFYESKGQDDQYLNIDFHLGEKVGLSAGATVRLGPVDITAAFQHTFFGTLDNKGKGALYGLSGDSSTASPENAHEGGPYRTYQAINGGKLQSDLNEVALGATLRF